MAVYLQQLAKVNAAICVLILVEQFSGFSLLLTVKLVKLAFAAFLEPFEVLGTELLVLPHCIQNHVGLQSL